jgi:hypothetical protein
MTPAAAAALAQKLIAKNGNTIQALKLSATVLDADKPWQGAGAPTVATSTDVSAVMVPHASNVDLGVFGIDDELLKRCDEVYLIPGQGATDLKTYHLLSLSGVRRKIEWVRELRFAPLGASVMYAVGVKR